MCLLDLSTRICWLSGWNDDDRGYKSALSPTVRDRLCWTCLPFLLTESVGWLWRAVADGAESGSGRDTSIGPVRCQMSRFGSEHAGDRRTWVVVNELRGRAQDLRQLYRRAPQLRLLLRAQHIDRRGWGRIDVACLRCGYKSSGLRHRAR